VLDPDSDGDGLWDGTELGDDCSARATDASRRHCVADADMGATRTSPVNPDTDFGGRKDGDEDVNHDGAIDRGETDPNDPRDDRVGQPCASDADCDDDECKPTEDSGLPVARTPATHAGRDVVRALEG